MRRNVALLLGILLGFACGGLLGCQSHFVPFGPVPPPPTPPTPPPPPPPPPPPNPNPTAVVPYSAAHSILVGWTRAQVDAVLVIAPTVDSRQDDGSRIAEWAALGEDGGPRWLNVTFGTDGRVIGLVFLPRAPETRPPAPVAHAPNGECQNGTCGIEPRR